MATITANYDWPIPQSTDLVKDGATAIASLGNAIDTSLAAGKGEILVGTTNNTVDNLAVGSNGSTLVADSSASTGLIWMPSNAAGKNILINGGFDIWQRGTSFTAAGYTADRWSATAATNVTYARETLTVGNISTYGMKITSSSATNSVQLAQGLEDIVANQIRGKSITLSFDAYCSSGTVSLVSYIQKNTTANIVGSSGWNTISSPTNTVTTSNQRFKVGNVSIPSDSSAAGIRFLFLISNMADATSVVISNVQVEVGGSATTFTRAGGTLAGELAACQRYYIRFIGNGGNDILSGLGWARQTTDAHILFPFPVEMRTAPTGIETATIELTDLVNEISAGTVTLSGASTSFSGQINCATSGLTQYRPYVIRNDNNAAGYVAFTAEL